MVQESVVEGERRLREMEGKLQCDRKEMDRLIQEENGLIVELRGCRDLLESARMQCDTLQYEYECRLKEQTELHGAELEKVRNTKQCARVDRGCDAIPYKDETVEATLAQLSQEKMTLCEENAGVPAENERLAKQCVDLERAAKDAVAKAQEAGVHWNKPGIVRRCWRGRRRRSRRVFARCGNEWRSFRPRKRGCTRRSWRRKNRRSSNCNQC